MWCSVGELLILTGGPLEILEGQSSQWGHDFALLLLSVRQVFVMMVCDCGEVASELVYEVRYMMMVVLPPVIGDYC